MGLLSPGVRVQEFDNTAIVPSLSNSIGVFGGDFTKGPVEDYRIITTVDDLILYYGKPTNTNYNDWFQVYNFLQYGNKIYVARAANTGGTATDTGSVVDVDILAGATTITTANTTPLTVGEKIVFGDVNGVILTDVYTITAITAGVSFDIDKALVGDIIVANNAVIYKYTQTTNALVDSHNGVPGIYTPGAVVIKNDHDFEIIEPSLVFEAPSIKTRFYGRNPGTWAHDIEVAVATPSAFGTAVPSLAFDGVALDEQFEYAPTGTEVAILVRYQGNIVEKYVVDYDVNAKAFNNKSTYIEKVINAQSSYIFVKDNTANTTAPADSLFEVNGTPGATLTLANAEDSAIGADDLLLAYELFDNKEYLDIDIVIGNEKDSGASCKKLVETRLDCIGFIGAEYNDVVGKKSTLAVQNLIAWRKTGSLNFNSQFLVACGNYKYIYDRYNDRNRWVNIAGDIAGLRAQTSTSRASWWASAGLERGQIKNAIKLAFNPNNGQRDLLYKNGINPIVSFAGQGIVMWGQKTLLDKASAFDRVNVRGLFNTLERSLSKMARYKVMELNDTFTRNRINAMIKPYLGTVKAGRGIDSFLVICDETNNTKDVIARNELVVDIYIKPIYVAEFINLRFTNAGTNNFSQIIGA